MSFSIDRTGGKALLDTMLGRSAKPAKPKGGDPKPPKPKGSSFDRAKAQQATGPSLQSAYDAYRRTGKAGGMTPQDAAVFERGVEDGQIMLPRGASLRVKPAAPSLPRAVVEAYNSRRMDDDPDSRKQVEDAIASGRASLPRGMRLDKPAPRTGTETALMSLGSAAEGIGQLADMAQGALSTSNPILKLLPPNAGSLAVGSASSGLPKPESDTEKLTSSIISGATQGLVTGPLMGAESLAARALNTGIDVIAGGASGGAQETARQAGAGPVGQLAAGLVGGAAPIGLAATAERAVTRIRAPKDLPAVVAEVPRAAVVDEAGNLTPDGQEIAARHGASPEEVIAAYEAPPKVKEAVANDQLEQPVAREATTGQPVADEVPVNDPTIPQAPNAPGPTPSAAPAASPSPDTLPETALARVEQGKELGIDYSRGQATKNFDVQDAESRLRNSNGPEAEQMRQFVAKQTDQVKAAVDDFKAAFGDKNLSAEQRGTSVQEAVRELRDLGQKGVTAAYKELRDLGQEVPLDVAPIRNTIEGLMAEADIPENVKRVMEQEAARYGLIGKPVEIGEGTGKFANEANVTTVKLDDGQTIKFRGEPQTLRLDNAEDFRQVISKQYMADGPLKLTRELKTAIDDASEAAAVKLAQYDQTGAGVPEAATRAREAHQDQVKTFKAKDIVQAIADWKKGTATDALKPEQVMQQTLAKISDLKRVKTVLLTKPTVKSKAAWRAIQAHGLATVFDKATTRNTNIAGITDAISGAKLRTALEDFGGKGQGPAMLKVLLDPDDFNKLMKLRRTIEDVTIPIGGTTNPSGSGNLLMRLVKDVDNQFTAALGAAGMALAGPAGAGAGGMIGRAIGPAVREAKASKAAAETLEGVTNYTPEKAATDTGEKPASVASKDGATVRQAGAKTVRAFIDTYSSPRILASVLASQPGEPEK